jgi:hypothetical protein
MLVPLWGSSALIAGVASLFGMLLGREKALSWRAWRPILAVLVFDMAAGVGTLSVIWFTYQRVSVTPVFWPAVVAGVSGPAIIRARTPKALRKKIGDWRLFGALRELQQKAESDIDKISTGAETSRLEMTLSKLDSMTLDDTADWVIRYMGRSNRKGSTRPDRTRQKKIQQVQDTLLDHETSELLRKKTIVQILLDVEGYRAVRALVQKAKSVAPRPVFVRQYSVRRYSLEGLRRGLSLPPGYRVESLEGRIRIGYPDRHIDDELRRLASRLKDELGRHALVEGVYEGWIVLRSNPPRGSRRRCTTLISGLVDQLRECPAFQDLVFQRDGVVLDPNTGLYASAALVVSLRDAPPHEDAFCPNAFSGKAVKLAGDIAISGSGEDARIYKRKMYAIAQVLIYLLLDLERRTITLYSEPVEGKYISSVSIAFGEAVRLPTPFDVELDTRKLVP